MLQESFSNKRHLGVESVENQSYIKEKYVRFNYQVKSFKCP